MTEALLDRLFIAQLPDGIPLGHRVSVKPHIELSRDQQFAPALVEFSYRGHQFFVKAIFVIEMIFFLGNLSTDML